MKSQTMKRILSTATAVCFLAGAPLAAFDLKPLVIPLGREVTVTIRATSDAEKKILAETPVFYLSDQGFWTDGEAHGAPPWSPEWQPMTVTRGDGSLSFPIKVKTEGWHNLRLGTPVPGKRGKFPPKTPALQLYSLADDLFAMRPWKGDIHQHSIRCGHAKLEPQVIPAYNRRVGFDFMALSEHRKQPPSIEAIKAAEPWKSGLVLFPAEEFHCRFDALHAVALGHRDSITAYPAKQPAEFKRRVAEEKKRPIYRKYHLNARELEQAAIATVLFAVAREYGAVFIAYSHPVGLIGQQGIEDPTQNYRSYMIDNADYDALEMNSDITPFNGKTKRADRMMLMTSLWVEANHRKGRIIPVVGVDDNHNQAAEWFGNAYTVFFAPKCSLADFVDAVKNLRTLAVRHPDAPTYMCFGPSRLMKFEQFLGKYYWPEHDKLCRKQGELLLKRAAGDTSVQPEIEKLAAAIEAYRESCYAPAR